MPPRKKLRVSSTAEPSTPSAATPGDISQAPDKAQDDNATKPIELEPELWTDEEEISLFKGMIRWKPVGMHKRFRMISLSRHMRHHGHISEHTRPNGIRQKLDVLYNMKVLDERENASADDIDSDERHCDFNLPASEFYDRMMSKRLDTDRESSPEWLNEPGDQEVESTAEESEDLQSSRASSVRGARGGRRGRGTRKARGGRVRGQKDSALRDKTKTESGTSGADSDEEEDNAENNGSDQAPDDGEDEDEEESEEDEDDDGAATQSPAPASRNARGRGRSRVSRGRGRGRKRG